MLEREKHTLLLYVLWPEIARESLKKNSVHTKNTRTRTQCDNGGGFG